MSATTLAGSDLEVEDQELAGPELVGDLGDDVVSFVDEETEGGQLAFTFSVGGKLPTSTMLRLMGGKIEVEGEFEKGEKIVLQVIGSVDAIEFVDIKDPKTGQVVGCERRHKARIVGVSVGE